MHAWIYFTRASSFFAQPGWLGLALPMWAELGPAQKKHKKIEKNKIKNVYA
jgi:hypothetical protein